MKCLILGGSGFLGENLSKELLEDGHSVRVFDRPMKTGEKPKVDVEWCEGDFLNIQDLEKAMNGCDVIFHLITMSVPQSSNDNPIYDVQSNLLGTIEMLSIAVKCGVKKIIFPSSGGTIYGIPEVNPIPETHSTNPICSYGITKLAIEKYLSLYERLFGLDYQILRIANPFGEGQKINSIQGAVGVFTGKAIREESVEIWGDGSVVRDYIHVKDVSRAFVKAMDYSGSTRIFNIGSGIGKSLNQVLDSIEKSIGKPIDRVYMDARAVDIPLNILDNQLAKSELSWDLTVNFDEGIDSTVKYYTKQYQNN